MKQTTFFFLGIGGISMSALANLMLYEGHIVYGSDTTENTQIIALRELGAIIHIGHATTNIPQHCNIIITNAAIPDNTPELVFARQHNITIIDRSKFLAKISRQYDNIIAVAGTHGKSTTTAMIGEIFKVSKKRPTVHNGALRDTQNPLSNLEIGEKEFFITEACEFKKSFLTLNPTTAVITNINPDHMDCYDDMTDLLESFAKFSSQSKNTIFNPSCQNSQTIKSNLSSSSANTFFLQENYSATDIKEYMPGYFSFTTAKLKIKLAIPGYHNIQNALLAIATAKQYKILNRDITYALNKFRGIARRFETIGQIQDTKIIIDYAHHPKEIETTIKTTNSLFKNPLYIFQPHTYSRTKTLFSDFVNIFKSTQTDPVILYKTYAAREKVIKGATAKDIAIALDSKYFATELALINHIKKLLHLHDSIIFIGAGNIDQVANNLLKTVDIS